MADKLYKVINKGSVHLVKANSTISALRYIVNREVVVEKLGALEAAQLVASGQEIEDASGTQKELGL